MGLTHWPNEKCSHFCSGALLLLRFLWFSGLYFSIFICESPSLKSQFIVEKPFSRCYVPYQNWSWGRKWALIELGGVVTWKLALAFSCNRDQWSSWHACYYMWPPSSESREIAVGCSITVGEPLSVNRPDVTRMMGWDSCFSSVLPVSLWTKPRKPDNKRAVISSPSQIFCCDGVVQRDVIIIIIANTIIRVTGLVMVGIQLSAESHPWKAVILFGSCINLSVSGSFQRDCRGW